jgi:hypothetical protein
VAPDVISPAAYNRPTCTCGAADGADPGAAGGEQEFIFGSTGYGTGFARGRAGRWFRRGGRIVLLGV